MTNFIKPTFEGDFILPSGSFRLEAGGLLDEVVLRYALYGELNARRDNAVLVCHALSGSARIGDWWPELFGAGRFLDLERHCVVGINMIGSCYGSTGPASVNPRTGTPYGRDFPLVTIRDMVRAQAELIDALGIRKLSCVVGASVGGMQALQWTTDFPDRVESAVVVGTAPLSALGLALNHLQRRAITLDSTGADGLALARAVAMCSYKSAELFAERFARRPNRNGENPHRSPTDRFDVAGYLDYQGDIFVRRFNPESYVVISKAMDLFDLANGHASEADALRRIRAEVLLVGISSDWLFPAADVRALADRMRAAGVRARYAEFVTSHGHDGFLADPEQLNDLLIEFFEPEAVPA